MPSVTRAIKYEGHITEEKELYSKEISSPYLTFNYSYNFYRHLLFKGKRAILKAL
jgi:hypothetical protein